MPTNVLFVCLGNICRSPTAQGVFQQKVNDAGLADHIFVDSAGTSGWHIGDPPDSRSSKIALKRGYDLSRLRGRQVHKDDFKKFDYILAMDNNNLRELQNLAPSNYAGRLDLFLSFSGQKTHSEVPDPYYGDGDGFNLVLDLIEDACAGLLSHIQTAK